MGMQDVVRCSKAQTRVRNSPVECLINWEYEDSKGRKHGIAAKASAQSEAPIAHAVSAKQSGCNDNKLNPSSEFDYQHIRRRISFKMAIAVR